MPNVIIIHGTGGYPEENWFPWLKGELEKLGSTVFVPQMPNPEKPSLDAWMETFQGLSANIDEGTIIIGHSLGGALTLRILEEIDTTIRAAFLVASPAGVPPTKNWETDLPFVKDSFDWDTIKEKAKHFTVFHSDNDPFVSLDNGKLIAEKLGVELTFVPNAGHFNVDSGYKAFPMLLERIKEATHIT
jgi:uncharacterized protein